MAALEKLEGFNMLNSILLRISLLALSIVLIASFATSAQACPELIEADCMGGTAWFGLRHDGAVVGQGQTATLICDSAVLSVEFMFVVNGNPNVTIPSMVAGDEIHVALLDADGNLMTSASTALPTDIFDGWLEFVFPADFVVPAGLYQFAAYTTVERQCAMRFAYGDVTDCYDGGNRIASLNGLEGPWGWSDGNDIPFRLHLSENLVAHENLAWGAIKGLYR